MLSLGPKKVSGFWSSVGFNIGAVTRFFYFASREIRDILYTRGPNFPYTKYGGLERPHKSGKRSYPYVKKSFKAQHGTISIDPAILAAIGHRFMAKRIHNKNAVGRDWGNARGDQKQTFLGALNRKQKYMHFYKKKYHRCFTDNFLFHRNIAILNEEKKTCFKITHLST